ncbi:MAG: hypothetical protein JWM44_3036 [Bacilli bacterium]|nr:hypothetical protein [Bacilli bacterium]
MSGDEIIKEIENLHKDEREKVLGLLIRKYFKDTFFCNSDWWGEEDNIYDELYGDSNNGVAPSNEECLKTVGDVDLTHCNDSSKKLDWLQNGC